MLTWIGVILTALAIGFGTGWEVHDWKTDAARKAEQDKAVVVADDKAVKHEEFKAKERIRYVTITKTVDRIVTKPFYTESPQCLDDDGLRELTEAIHNPSFPASAVPASGASK